MILNDAEKEIVSGILKTKERVVYIYNRYPAAIESDKELIRMFKDLFGAVDATDGITRAGRNLRQKHADRYIRSQVAQENSERMQEIHRTVWK